MNLLLDTHTYLWFIVGNNRLSDVARSAIEDAGNQKFISVASLWEITIKHRLGKLQLKTDLQKVLTDHVVANGFELLPLDVDHFLELNKLPMHHRDPFDRLLIAQAVANKLTVCSVDTVFSKYDVELLW